MTLGPLLAIETSCDESAAAVLDDQGRVLSNVVHSQIKDHAPYGGVVPEIASREHLARLPGLVRRALDEAGVAPADLQAVAATYGPGLIGALLVGLQYAKGLAQGLNTTFIGVHHLEGHLMAGTLDPAFDLAFPFIGLVASGGHSALYRVEEDLSIQLLGETRDDAAGEAFDKSAKLLGLGYPGGAVIDRRAAQGDDTRFDFPVSLRDRGTYDFSFSGLKTKVRLTVEKLQAAQGALSDQDVDDVCACLRKAIVEALVSKSVLACRRTQVHRLVLGGGVVANSRLREEAVRRGADNDIAVYVPPRPLCTDNAAMIGAAALARLRQGRQHALTLAPRPSLPLGDDGRA